MLRLLCLSCSKRSCMSNSWVLQRRSTCDYSNKNRKIRIVLSAVSIIQLAMFGWFGTNLVHASMENVITTFHLCELSFTHTPISRAYTHTLSLSHTHTFRPVFHTSSFSRVSLAWVTAASLSFASNSATRAFWALSWRHEENKKRMSFVGF